jgi:hypothetical protein
VLDDYRYTIYLIMIIVNMKQSCEFVTLQDRRGQASKIKQSHLDALEHLRDEFGRECRRKRQDNQSS